MPEDEIVRWHHLLNGHKFEQILGTEDRGAWWAAVRGFAKGRTQLSE